MNTKTKRMFTLIDQWRGSGKTRKEFCNQQDLSLSTFAYWITKKNRAEISGRGFLPIDVSAPARGAVQISYPNGVKVTLPGCDAALIRQLVRGL